MPPQVQLKAKNDMQAQAVDEAQLIFQHASAVTLEVQSIVIPRTA